MFHRVVFLIFFSASACFSASASDGYRVLPQGHSLRKLKGISVSGDEVVIGKARKPSVLFFFDPGCEMCKAVIPEFLPLYSRTADSLQWVAITCIQDTTRLNEFIRDTGLPWNVICIAQMNWNECRIDATPTVYLTDCKSRVVSGRMVRVEDLLPLLR